MADEFLRLYESGKALITYIDKEDVFDRAAAGGCSGLDFHQSDAFYDLIVNTRNIIGRRAFACGQREERSNERRIPKTA